MRRAHRLAGLGVSILAAAAACGEAKGPPVATAKPTIADSADQIVFHSRTVITDHGLQRAEILSDTAFFFDQNTRLEMRIVNGVFYSANGAKDAVLTSRSGLYNTRLGSLEARGDVVVNSVDGRKLTTPYLRYDQQANKISSDSSFVLTEPNREVRGIGFVSDPDMQDVRIKTVKSSRVGPVAVPEK